MERRKKPWESQRQLESRSLSEPSSLEQPESLDSRRASSMLTSTECRSRNSAPALHDIARTIHYHRLPLTPPLSSLTVTRHERAIRLSRTAPTRMAVDSGLCGRCVARRTVTRATYLPAADPPEKVRVPPAPARSPNGPRRSRMRRRRCTGAPDIGRAHPGGVAARGRSPRVVDRSIAQPRRLPRDPPRARELGCSPLGSSTGSTPGDVKHASRPTSMRARSPRGCTDPI
ncbi:unnamed protein product [Chrysodeixis includens]|uniref:Uncharacterized protein n=1 Tax=Chrysodeixis includens TaxID=689277 RepID=A0A9N8PZ16_CHRIL|nr:unnamed protein product [Chrysodeixis includens]